MAISFGEFDYIRNILRQHSALSLDDTKQYLVESRLDSLARQEGFPSLRHLIAQLQKDPRTSPLHSKVVEAMTTNETTFFRDVRPFRLLEKLVFPELIARRQNERALNIWCAASSSGQEPYSVAMLIRENFPALSAWSLRFIASDISQAILDRAQAGRYTQLEVNRGLPAAMLVKYFRQLGTEWEIREDIRKMIEFRRVNLIDPWPPLPEMDLILVRNVLIYFEVEKKKEILERARRLLRPDGFLLLGGAETTINLDDSFEPVQFEQTSCYRIRPAASRTSA
ncbi:MAG TPA: protein-glutamate O-methyltransferase CheR, partial [Terriglobia bacterium]|nr:protein-glutamate O-methyltransferase CheR [Terriglobia bacterium]